ncbi:hypothetical protein [Galactobacter sp.]|uniref:hypothetical protein n=1 Tax=Galactobacter sp. TaxID=2676125 RepID=UPI0025B99620|nr:hypothetical protein [Galactobacter sp.]
MVADYLAAELNNEHIDRQVKTGAADRGDVRGVTIAGHKLAIECKDVHTLALPAWTREAQAEAANLGAVAGVVVHKRRGTQNPGDQWVSMTLADLAKIIRSTNA